MTKGPDLRHDYQVFILIHWAMVMTAAVMGIILVSMLFGNLEQFALPAGVGGVLLTIACMAYAAKEVKGRHREGTEMAFWEKSIKNMTSINICVGLLLVVMPYLPL